MLQVLIDGFNDAQVHTTRKALVDSAIVRCLKKYKSVIFLRIFICIVCAVCCACTVNILLLIQHVLLHKLKENVFQ